MCIRDSLTASADGAAKALFMFDPREEAWQFLRSKLKRSLACPSRKTSVWSRSSSSKRRSTRE
eukprot:12077804-Prorocentrum_lima.AAC.1